MRNNGDTFEHALWDRSTYKIDLNGKEPKVKKTEDKKTELEIYTGKNLTSTKVVTKKRHCNEMISYQQIKFQETSSIYCNKYKNRKELKAIYNTSSHHKYMSG